jgi:hypothetical protein
VFEVSPGHLFKFQRLLKKYFYWQRAAQLYGPPYIKENQNPKTLGRAAFPMAAQWENRNSKFNWPKTNSAKWGSSTSF